MAETRLYRLNVFLGLAYLEAFANPSAPTSTELNNSTYVKDLTCALSEDTTEFTLGDSDTDSTLTFCTNASTVTPTVHTATIDYKVLRDQDRSATGYFGRAMSLLSVPDIDFYAIERLGKPNTSAFAVGDIVRIVQVKTDNPLDVLAVDADVFLEMKFLSNNFINWNYTLLS